MDAARVVEVWVPAFGRVGSGYLLAGNLVLTSYHVVQGLEPGALVEVRALEMEDEQPTGWLEATVCWPHAPVDIDAAPGWDAALLVINDPSRKVSPVRFGRVAGQDRVACVGLGFPDAEARPDRRDTMPVRGNVDPLQGRKSDLLTVHVDEGIVPRRLAGGSGWAGGSGTALFCGPLLVGVLATDRPIADDASVLGAVPMAGLADQPGFRETLSAHGISMRFEPAAASVSGPLLRPYLAAARRAAHEHPYAGVLPGTTPPLATVYLRQQIRQLENKAGDGRDVAPAPREAGTSAPASDILADAQTCVILSGPGGGKSSLLRTGLADAARRWLDGYGETILPVLVPAAALTAQLTLPQALAASVTADLTQHGLVNEIPAAFFATAPQPGVRWLVLIDGLDEIADPATRRRVLKTVASIADSEHGRLYRFVIATRPLSDGELNTLGTHTPHYDLQPFGHGDLPRIARNWFRALHLPDPDQTAEEFAQALNRSRMAELACIPLMTAMLCQLYVAQPERPLPAGRTAVYEAFTDLLYENNQHKRVADSHEQAIQHLVQSLQSPRTRKEADAAARQVHERLPDLIDYLAHQWLTGQQTPIAEALASHGAVHRPGKVRPERWDAFLEDLLQHTGLLVHQSDGLGFPHQTFLEYHAARHATRDEEACAAVLDGLFPPGRKPQVPLIEPSYLGFLLDGLLAAPDDIAAETTNRIKALTRKGAVRSQALANRSITLTRKGAVCFPAHPRGDACRFLVEQVDLRTGLPTTPTARQLNRLSQDTSLGGFARAEAARALAGVDGYRDAGADRLIAFTEDTTLDDADRMEAARALAGVDGYQDRAAQFFAELADDTTLDGHDRVEAAEELAGVDGYRDAGASRLIVFAEDTSLGGFARVGAACVLAGVDGYQDRAAQFFAELADNTTLDDADRMEAARALAGVDGYRDHAAQLLAQLADDTTLDGFNRLWTAETLARLDGYQNRAAPFFVQLADDITLDTHDRVEAADELAGLDGFQDAGAGRLIAFADDTTLDGYERMRAADALAGVEGYRDRAAQFFAELADDTTLDEFERMQAARALAEVDGGAEPDDGNAR